MEERGLLIQKGRSEGILYWDPFWTQGPVERRMDEATREFGSRKGMEEKIDFLLCRK